MTTMAERYDTFDQFDETAEAPLAQEFLMECRNRKTAVERKNNLIFWAHILMAGILFALTVFLGGVVARDTRWEGPQKFYVSFTLGLSQILTALATLGFGFWAHQKRRIPTYVLIAFFIIHIFYTVLAPYDYFDFLYIICDVVGIVLNYYRLSLIAECEWLKKQPGYPYFTVSLLQKNEYELPKYITHRRSPSNEMDTVGDAALEFQTETTALSQPRAESAAPVPSADVLLADMTVPETAPTHGALPDPEEVKARLRRMAEEKTQDRQPNNT